LTHSKKLKINVKLYWINNLKAEKKQHNKKDSFFVRTLYYAYMTNSYPFETWWYFKVCCISPSCTADAVCTTVHLWQSWIWQQSCSMNKLCEHIWELRLDIILEYSMLKNITDMKCYKHGGLKKSAVLLRARLMY